MQDDETKVKFCLYARKSSEQDETIDSQIKEVSELAEKANIEIVEIRKESHSAKISGARSIFNQILSDTPNLPMLFFY